MSDEETVAPGAGRILSFADLLLRLAPPQQLGSRGIDAKQGTAAGPNGDDPGATARAVAQFLGQAWTAYVSSGLRSWSQAADAWARMMPPIARAFAEAAGTRAMTAEERALLIDELRARFRELAESPVEQARLLQSELDRIAATLWSEPDSGREGRYWRRWEAKP